MSKFLLPLTAIISLSFFISCQKEISNDLAGGGGTTTGNFKAKIDGVQWVANKTTGAFRANGFISITGTSTNGKSLAITLIDSGLHHYTLNENTINVAAFTDTASGTFSFGTNEGTVPGQSGGTLDITSIDTLHKTISGTFSFIEYRQIDNKSKNFTEGSFTNITYTTSLPASSASDTFHVKINGTLWTPPSIFSIAVGGQIAVSGSDATGSKAVALYFPSTITPGNYSLDFLSGTYMGQYNPDLDPNHIKVSATGTLTILEHNTTTKRIRGNFNFHGTELLNPLNTADLTEGYFSVKYN